MSEEDREHEEEKESGKISTSGRRTRADIPERIIKKLARVAGLPYVDKAPRGGGGLCCDIEGWNARRKALKILGLVVSNIGRDSTDKAIKEAGATWLDLLGWREEVEYSQLWAAAMRVKREVAAARLEDELWDRGLNGYEVSEPKNTRDGIEMVDYTKFDNGLGINLLKGGGFISRVGPPRSAKGVAALRNGGEKPAPGVDATPEEKESGVSENIDTVLFDTRKGAYEGMAPAGGKKESSEKDGGDNGQNV